MKVSFYIVLLVLLSPVLTSCYITKLAYHQNNLFNSRQLIDEVLYEQQASKGTLERLELVKGILSFAATEGLKVRGSYNYYIETKQPYVSYAVQAAYSDKLQFVKWWFPIVGSVPYLGYFDKSDRDQEAKRLARQGYDVAKFGVSAFSSLGWFEDPIYSSMLRRSTGSLASLLFHELVHRSFWIPDQAEFNEQIASYVEWAMTIKFLQQNGFDKDLLKYQEKVSDRAVYRTWLKKLKKALKDLFEPQTPSREKVVILREKEKIFQHFVDHKPSFKRYDYVAGTTWNNAAVLGASIYSPDIARFDTAYKCTKLDTLGPFLDMIKGLWEQTQADPFDILDGLCKLKQEASHGGTRKRDGN